SSCLFFFLFFFSFSSHHFYLYSFPTRRSSDLFLFKFKHDKVFLLGASQAFYYLLSIFPILVIGLAIIPYLNIDPEQAVGFLKDTLPGDLANVFQEDFLKLIKNQRGWLLVVGIGG